jgi:hypothetical protein
MVSKEMIVPTLGADRIAGELQGGELMRVIEDFLTGELLERAAQIFGPTVKHACQRVITVSGITAVVSNNALLAIDDPQRNCEPGQVAKVNCQMVGLHRVAVLRDGLLSWEPARAQAIPASQDVVQLLPEGQGLFAASEDASKGFIFVTGAQ